MLKLIPEYYEKAEEHLKSIFFNAFFRDILNLVNEPQPRLNAAPGNAIIAAIRSGKVRYIDGRFFGSFTAKISRDLSRFATFDKRSKTWAGDPPPAVKAEAILAERKRKNIAREISREIDKAQARIDEMIKTISFNYDLPLFKMDKDIEGDIGIGIIPEMTESMKKKILEGYTKDQIRNIKNWAPEQVERLRRMTERVLMEGSDRGLTEIILEEWGVSYRKAAFLARQETNLFFSEYSMSRARDAGIRRYRWSTSHDRRVRQRHRELDGKTIDFDRPPVVDIKTGRRAHAGEDFLCRCGKIWILDDRKIENSIQKKIRAWRYKYPGVAA